MESIYQAFGFSAGISQRMSRFRVNGIPFNLLPGLIFLMILMGGSAATLTSLITSKTPEKATVEAVGDSQDFHDYVTITGLIVNEPVITSEVEGRASKSYFLLMDEQKKNAIIVEDQLGVNPFALKDNLSKVTLEGIMHYPTSNLQKELLDLSESRQDIRISTYKVLIVGDTPYSTSGSFFVMLIGIVLNVLFWYPYMNRYVVFRPDRAAVIPDLPQATLPDCSIRVTGEFALTEKVRQRFLSIPCAMNLISSGDLCMFCNVDASEKLYGFTFDKRVGYWLMSIQRGPGVRVIVGRQYLGSESLPTARLIFSNGFSRRPQESYISFENQQDLEKLIQFIRTPPAPSDFPAPPPVHDGLPPKYY